MEHGQPQRGNGAPAPTVFDRLPPQDPDAERGVLGSLLLDPLMCDEVSLAVRPEEFYVHAHQVLFRHMLALHNEGKRIDATLLVDRLRQHGDLDAAGGVPYLREVVESVPTAANAVHYARIVRAKSTLRQLIHASTEIIHDAYDQSQEARELLAAAEQKIFRILDEQGTGDVAAMADVLQEALSRIDARLERGAGIGGLPTGFTDLDARIGGLHPSELIILAARPSMGKTALATNITDHVAVNCRQSVLFVSLEMSRLELAERMLCSRGRINGHKLRNGFLSALDKKKLVEVAAEMSAAPLYIDDTPSRTMTEIAATARRLKRQQGLALVVIDYLQLIEPDNPRDPRQEQVARIARRLKGLARELKIPVLCLAQLNRQAEVTRDNRPRLSHLRESGAIEQDADVVMFVHRDEYYATSEEERSRLAGQADVMVAKQRNGPTGDVKLVWLQEYTRFENFAHAAVGEYEPF
ncbi:MAG: replicative DNA helicase [Pirellulales bacterium]|nr:replicative DNA helicase [Pirellulales bacterium]